MLLVSANLCVLGLQISVVRRIRSQLEPRRDGQAQGQEGLVQTPTPSPQNAFCRPHDSWAAHSCRALIRSANSRPVARTEAVMVVDAAASPVRRCGTSSGDRPASTSHRPSMQRDSNYCMPLPQQLGMTGQLPQASLPSLPTYLVENRGPLGLDPDISDDQR